MWYPTSKPSPATVCIATTSKTSRRSLASSPRETSSVKPTIAGTSTEPDYHEDGSVIARW